jgi:carboxyl-terminal processing protease
LATTIAITGTTLSAAPATGAAPSTASCQPTAPGSPPPPDLKPTTLTTLKEAYFCILAHAFGATTLDDRTLLVGSFASITQTLERVSLDQPTATLPPLTGDRTADWAGFSRAYTQITNHLPADAAIHQAIAAAALQGMVESLHDNHAQWTRPSTPSPRLQQELMRRFPHGYAYGLGINTSTEPGPRAQPDAHPPLFITAVWPGGPADAAGLKAGDVIAEVNGVPPFPDGRIDDGVMNWLSPTYPNDDRLAITISRTSTGAEWTTSLRPAFYADPPLMSATTLPTSLVDVQLRGFAPGVADIALAAVRSAAQARPLKGIILDLRGNNGGDPSQVARLLGGFVHDRVWSYDVDANGNRVANHVDNTVPLLGLPLVVLTDRNCVSACDAFAAAVKDLHMGTIIGARTAGIVSGPARGYTLDDNSLLLLPPLHELAAGGEIINGIGVAPDYFRPVRPQDLAVGRDPAVDEAVRLLARQAG